MADQDGMNGGINRRGRSTEGDFEVNYGVGEPFSKLGDSGRKLATSFVAGIDGSVDLEVGTRGGDETGEMLKEEVVELM